MKVAVPSLAPILRSDTQGRILARLFGDPEAEYTLTDLADGADTSFPTTQREVNRAEQAGIVTVRRVGPARLVRANSAHPLFKPLRQLLLATYGPPIVVARQFANIDGAAAVILFGSWAARYAGEAGRAPNDIDVLVLGEADRDAVDDAADRAEREIGLPVQATVRSLDQWRRARESFITEVKQRPLVPVLVDEGHPDLGRELQALPAKPEETP
jgi:predicted nucleotidyltransferase